MERIRGDLRWLVLSGTRIFNWRFVAPLLFIAYLSTAFAQTMGALKTREGCSVDLDMKGSIPTLVSWNGGCTSGLASGVGLLIMRTTGGATLEYKGSMINGKREGQGRYRLLNGDVYEGGFRDNAPNGDGTMIYKHGNRLVGEYRNGRLYSGSLYNSSDQKIGTLAPGADSDEIYRLSRQ